MKSWSLSQKIWSILGLLIFAFVGSTIYSVTRIDGLRDTIDEITSVTVIRDQLTSAISDNQRAVIVRVLESIIIEDPELLKKNAASYANMLKKQEEDMKHFNDIASEKAKAIFSGYQKTWAGFTKAMEKVREDAFANRNDEAIKEYLANTQVRDELRKYLTEVNVLTAEQMKQATIDANDMANTALKMGITIALISIIAASAIAFVVLRQLNKTIAEIVKSLADSSVQVSSAAGQIASSSEELSQATTEQAASLEETAASIEELNSMVAKNSENASSTAQISTSSQEKAGEGQRVVESMIQSMKSIDQSNANIMTQVNKSNDNMADIVKVIEEIGNKTKVINDIVFQTKLLSFNASVEAARAGEHGKGFAVVAEEVGNLAEMSGNAAKEISSMLEDSVNKVNTIVAETKHSVEKLIVEGKGIVENGARVAKQCGEVLEDIVKNVSTVASRADEIATASDEQARGVTEITKAMAQLDQVTQQNASVSEEAASAAEELSAQSESLKATVQSLVVTVNGAKNASNTFGEPQARPKKSSNVVPMKAKKATPSPVARPTSEAAPMKKASGGVPHYDHEGFEDV